MSLQILKNCYRSVSITEDSKERARFSHSPFGTVEYGLQQVISGT